MITVIKTSRPVKVTQISTRTTQINVRTTGQRTSKVTSVNVGRTGEGIDNFNTDPLAYYILAKN